MRKIILACIIVGASLAYGQSSLGAINGQCLLGNQFPILQGLLTTAPFLASYPDCTVTVYLAGTTTKATLFSTSTRTPLGNPFTANADASWLFYAQSGTSVDILMSGGSPFAMPNSLTLSGVGVPGVSFTLVPVEQFGAIGDWNGTTGTDNTAAFQACVNTITIGQCYVQGAAYKITAPITINRSSVGIGGPTSAQPAAGLFPVTPPSATIITTCASCDIIDLAGVSPSNALGYNQISGLTLARSVAPTGTARGLSIVNAYGTAVNNVSVIDSMQCFYFKGAGAVGVGYVDNSACSWGFNGITETSGTFYGFFDDSTGGVASPSLRIRNTAVSNNLGHSGSFSTYGYVLTGTQISDLHLFHPETANTDYGIYINAGSATFTNSTDIHVLEPILDGCWVTCISVNNIAGTVSINDGWSNQRGGNLGSDIDIESSAHVSLVGHKIYALSTGNPAILLQNSTSNIIANNDFTQTTGPGLSLVGSTGNVITGNVGNFFNTTTAFSFTNTSPSNLVYANQINGTLTNGILFDGTSSLNLGTESNVIGNSTFGVVTNPYSSASSNPVQATLGLTVGSVGGANLITKIYKTAISLTFTNISAQTCQDQSATVSGVAVGDPVFIAVPSGLPTNFSWSANVSAPNTVNVRACNPTSGGVNPGGPANWGVVIFH